MRIDRSRGGTDSAVASEVAQCQGSIEARAVIDELSTTGASGHRQDVVSGVSIKQSYGTRVLDLEGSGRVGRVLEDSRTIRIESNHWHPGIIGELQLIGWARGGGHVLDSISRVNTGGAIPLIT